MKAIDFYAANVKIAEQQEEYETLPAAVYEDQTVCCMKLSDKDVQNVIHHGLVWVSFSKRPDSPLTPFTLGFVKDVFDPEITEPRWGFETEDIEVETAKAHVTYTTQIKLTFWQRLKHLFTNKPLNLVGALDVESKYAMNYTVKNITVRDLHY